MDAASHQKFNEDAQLFCHILTIAIHEQNAIAYARTHLHCVHDELQTCIWRNGHRKHFHVGPSRGDQDDVGQPAIQSCI